jgi:WD40 repeat protein
MFKLWNAATKEYLGSLGDPDGDNSKRDTAVAFSPDGKLIATVTEDGFQLWDAASRKLLATPETGESFGEGLGVNWSSNITGDSQTVAFSPNGKMVAACLYGICQLWDVASGKLLTPPRSSLKSADGTPAFFTRFFSADFAFSPDSRTLAFSAGKLNIWDIKSQSTIQTLEADSLNSLGFLPDGKLFASGGYYNKLLVFERDATTKQFTPLPPMNISDRTSKVLFSPDGQTFVTATDSELAYGGNVQLWDANSRKLLATFEGLGTEGSVSALAFSPDGQTLAIGSNTSLQLSDARARRSIEGASAAVHFPSGIFQLRSSPDNTKFAALVRAEVGYAVKLWDSNLTLLATFDVGLSDLLAFSNDGKTLATGSKDSGVSLRDISHAPYTEYELPLNLPCQSEDFTTTPNRPPSSVVTRRLQSVVTIACNGGTLIISDTCPHQPNTKRVTISIRH